MPRSVHAGVFGRLKRLALRFRGKASECDVLRAGEYPVLAAIWDNECDAVYDDL